MLGLSISFSQMSYAQRRALEAEKIEPELENRERELDLRTHELELRKRELGLQMEKKKLDLKQKMMGRKFHRKYYPGFARKCRFFCGLIFMCAIIVRILLAIIVFRDIKQYPNISGLWIVIVLIGGFLGGIIYAIFRISYTKT